MSIHNFLRLFVPPLYYEIKHRIVNRNLPPIYPLPLRKRKGNKMIVIGNGPSLSQSFEKYKDIICNTECVVVNFFASTEWYEIVRPSVYVLNDYAFFEVPDKLKLSVDKLLSNIISKTCWDMTIVIPNYAKNTEIVVKLSQNPNINIMYFNIDGKLSDEMNTFEAWDKNLISPPGGTVLVVGVWLSLYWGYPETYLIGADTSWISELKVDQQTNQLYTIDRHFYNNSDVYKENNLYDVEHRRILPNSIYYELKCITECFKSYEDLEEYANWKGLKVYNASEYSLIDAFERKKLQN